MIGFAGAIFEQGTDEIQAAFRYAVIQFNRINETGRKYELQAYVDVINTADTYKLSRLSESFFCCLLALSCLIYLQFFAVMEGRGIVSRFHDHDRCCWND